MKTTEHFAKWKNQFEALERLTALSPDIEKCEHHRVYLGWSDRSSFECNIPNFDNALAIRIVAALPNMKWERSEETYRVVYIGKEDGLEIQLHHAEAVPKSKPTVVITPLTLEAK